MNLKTLAFKHNLKVCLGNRQSQAAEMVLFPGDREGGPNNRHRGSDQWLYVVEGRGLATVHNRRIPLKEGMLILIKRGDPHEIRNTARRPLKTLNIYVPPAYTKNGNRLARGRP